jgi:hypothetical protein
MWEGMEFVPGKGIVFKGERTPCPPFMEGMLFKRTKDGGLWVVEKCHPLVGQVLLGYYHLPETIEEQDERESN